MRTRPDNHSDARPIVGHRRRTSLLGRYFAIIGAVALAGGIATAGIGVGEADAATKVTRSEALAAAKRWAAVPVPYNMQGTREGYRRDCSGMVSMAWKLGKPGLTTTTLPNVSVRISKNDLKPGDILNKKPSGGPYGHVVMFEKWANKAKTAYLGIEQTPPHTKRRVIPYPYFNGGAGYHPYRYKNIVDDKPKPKPTATKPKPTTTKPKPTATKPSPTATKPKPTSSPTASPSPSDTEGGGGGEGDEPTLPKTGAPAVLVAGTGGALLLGGTVLLLAGRRRGRYRVNH